MADHNVSDYLKFIPQHLCDPPMWYIRELDYVTMKELAINQVEMHKAILQAQIDASEKTLAILGRAGARSGDS